MFIDLIFIFIKNIGFRKIKFLFLYFQISLKRCYCWKNIFSFGQNKNQTYGNCHNKTGNYWFWYCIINFFFFHKNSYNNIVWTVIILIPFLEKIFYFLSICFMLYNLYYIYKQNIYLQVHIHSQKMKLQQNMK